jgi:hypothetical protein
MNKFGLAGLLLGSLLFGAPIVARAQEMPEVSKASEKYRTFRTQNTYPKLHLTKIKGLMKKVKKTEYGIAVLGEATFNKLTVSEKFTYCLYNGEEETQNCDAMLPIVDEEKKIFSYFPGAFNDEKTWSPRQHKFFENNRKAVLTLLAKNMRNMGRVGANFRALVIHMNAHEVIPDLVAVYKNDRKDHDILTLLMLLMKEGNYEPFMKSSSHEKLYGESGGFGNFLVANKANQDLIIDRAMGYNRSKK